MRKPETNFKRLTLACAGTAWLAVIVYGMGRIVRYQSTPGVAAAATAQWPATVGIARAKDRPTLLMFFHPQCACSQASLEELSRVQALCPGQADVRLLFFSPASTGQDWAQSDLWRTAKAMKGVTVVRDIDGALAKEFGVVTSGQALLYDAHGKLLFNGGITGARGHAGDNGGELAVVALLRGQAGAVRSAEAPVFGCEIRESQQSIAENEP